MSDPTVLWTPPPDVRQTSRIGAYLDWLARERGLDFDDYQALWRWSVTDLAGFWSSIWEYFDVISYTEPTDVLGGTEMPGVRWFPGATLNYAEHVLRAPGLAGDAPAVLGWSQTREPVGLTVAELREQVRRVAAGLRRLGVGEGDRVAAYLPNLPETVVLLLATASLGAVFSSCAPEFGTRSVTDRWRQIEPAVLVAVDGYRYGDKPVDRRGELAEIRAALPSVRHTVLLPYLDADTEDGWAELAAPTDEPLRFVPVPFDHPLYVLYSSGTTGLPKPIVHGHGGILLEHLKMLALHSDLGPGDRFFWYSTTGWMMWNYLVSGPAAGSAIVLYDGHPGHPNLGTLWRLAAESGMTFFGTSAPYLLACRKAGVMPRTHGDLSRLRGLGSTGAPLPGEGFSWVYENVSASLQLQSLSGGTDLCTGFLGGVPLLPVWRGEISCRCLGARVESYDPTGHPQIGTLGELVITAPMPSMPVGFWGDASGERYREAYFSVYPGVWRHGDWLTITERGSCVITGRSDATLNRGGVRLGTAEFYSVVEGLDEVVDSLVVHLSDTERDELLLFVVLAPGYELDDALRRAIAAELRNALSPRHVPDQIHAVRAVPRTLSGKKLEVPVKRILTGTPADQAAAEGALANPDSLAAFADLARSRDSLGGARRESVMVSLVRTSTGVVEQQVSQLTLDEYLALPEDTRAEIVDGMLRPMVRASKKSREVQSILKELLRKQKPRGLRVAEEEVVVLRVDPADSRIPDVVLFRGEADKTGDTNYTAAKDALLVVEVVSPGSQTTDRYEKPGEYARAGIPAFWRIELEPSISVHVYRLIDQVYRDEGVYTRGGLIKDPTLPWLSIEVNDLLGDYA